MLAMVQAVEPWRWRPGTPLGDWGDGPGLAALVRGFLDHGPYSDNRLFGAPFGLNAGWASTVDDVHIWVLSALGAVTADAWTVISIYFFLSFPAAALSMYWLSRNFGLARAPAVLAGVLFSVLPGQQERFPHLFLAAYWSLPFAVWVILEAAQGRSVLESSRDDTSRVAKWNRLVRTVLMLLAVGLSDVYYLVFTFLIAMPLILARQIGRRDWGELKRLVLPLSVIAAPAAVSLAIARIRVGGDELSGTIAFSRSPVDSDIWSGRLTDLILPWDGHRIQPLSSLSQAYSAAIESRAEESSLGVVALSGVVGLLIYVSSRALRSEWRALSGRLIALTVMLLLSLGYFTKGGLGSVVALFVTPQVRAWSRIFVFAAVVGLLAVGLWASHVRRRHGRGVALGLVTLLLVLGVWDQTSPAKAPAYEALRAKQAKLSAFASSLRERIGPGCAVFNLPVARYPEVPHASVRDVLALGVASKGLSWSFGAIKGTQAADWQLALPMTAPRRLLEDVAVLDFCAVVVHSSIAESAPALASGVPGILGSPIAKTADGVFAAYDLRPVRTELTERLTAQEWKRRADEALHPVVVTTSGMRALEGTGPVRLALGPRPSLKVSNLSRVSRRISLSATLDSPSDEDRLYQAVVSGRVSDVTLVTEDSPGRLTLDLEAPPGLSEVSIQMLGDQVDFEGYLDWYDQPFVSDIAVRGAGNVGVWYPSP